MSKVRSPRRTAAAARIAAAAALAALAAGCGWQGAVAAARHAAQGVVRLVTGAPSPAPEVPEPQYAKDGLPITVAALQAKYGKAYPGLAFTPQDTFAPPQPPFSLSPYPAQHTILWISPKPGQIPAWEAEGARVAAEWFMADQGNHPLTELQYVVKGANAGAAGADKGIYTDQEDAIHHIAQTFQYAVEHPTAAGYEYRTWSAIYKIAPLPADMAAQSKQFLPNEPVLHEEAVTLAVFQIGAGGGHFGYGRGGPITVWVVDLQRQGWKVLSWTAYSGAQLKTFPQTYHVSS
ncbi:MAG: hypothetical protein K6U87_05565 [Firmicutes bacterium]|nr:hypothetical protein [Bacillota bacterium]